MKCKFFQRLLAFTVLILFFILVLFFIGMYDTDPSVPFSLLGEEQDIRIDAWSNPDGKYYIFLPGCLELSAMRFTGVDGKPLYIDGTQIFDGMPCDFLSLDCTYKMRYGKRDSEIRFLKTSHIPTVHIKTNGENINDLKNLDKNDKFSGSLSVYDAKGNRSYDGDFSNMHIRGNTTSELPKKSYHIRLSEKANLLNLGEGDCWILLANMLDESNLRNQMIYDFAEDMGMQYTPGGEWADVYINHQYQGLYLLCEKNEIAENRVEISPEDDFLINIDRENRLIENKNPYFESDYGYYYRVRNQKKSLQATKAQWQSVENAIFSDQYTDPVTGRSLFEIIDLESWVKKYLIEEVFANWDVLSLFFYSEGGKIYAGPVWDYDFAMTRYGSSSAMVYEGTRIYGAKQINLYSMMGELMENKVFFHSLQQICRDEFLPRLEILIHQTIPEYAEKIESSSKANQIRWSVPEEAFENEVHYIRQFLQERADFLSDYWLGSTQYHKIELKEGNTTDVFYASDGATFKEVYKYADLSSEYYCQGSHEPFDVNAPVEDDIYLYTVPAPVPGLFLRNILISVFAVLFLIFLAVNIAISEKRRPDERE